MQSSGGQIVCCKSVLSVAGSGCRVGWSRNPRVAPRAAAPCQRGWGRAACLRGERAQMAQACPRRRQRDSCHALQKTEAWIWAKRDFMSAVLALAAFSKGELLPGADRGLSWAAGGCCPQAAGSFLSSPSFSCRWSGQWEWL